MNFFKTIFLVKFKFFVLLGFSLSAMATATDYSDEDASMNLDSSEVKTGWIREVACNQPSGLGYLVLESKKKKIYTSEWMRVNSLDLCSSHGGSKMSKLASIGYDGALLGNIYTFEVTLTYIPQLKWA
ncbi:MAG: hypothetical protein QE271_11860 [Bacteriovoracaceae bacterium]|nr:hypothetical protein [Bacteriovoracaceae bacterium]